MKKINLLLFVSILLIFSACTSNTKSDENAETVNEFQATLVAMETISEKVEYLLSEMTIDEKIGQMTQVDRQFLASEADIANYYLGSLLSGGGSAPRVNAPSYWADMYDRYQNQALSTRLAIPLIYGIDAVHGHNNVFGATIFPHNIGLGATNDAALVEKVAKATAIEVAATGIDWTFAPCITVPQDERWGRTYEGFSEVPSIVADLGAAAVRGYQGSSLSQASTILATAKHYVADGGTLNGVDRGDAQISEEELRAIHLSPYVAAINADVQSVMASFSSWNGEKLHSQNYLLETVLQDELGYNSFIVSDWAALAELPGTYMDQVETAINAGIDMVMVPDDYKKFILTMKALVNLEKISEERINEAVSRILRVKFALNLFEEPLTDRSLLDSVGSDEHRALAREAVQKSQVILKNDGVLPISSDTKNILVTGPFADDLGAQCGGWTISWQGERGNITVGTTILEAFQELDSETINVFTSLPEDGTVIDLAIVVIGETPYAEMFGDKEDLSIASDQLQLVKDIAETGTPTVTLLFSGRPMIVNDVIDYSDAFVASWLPGTEGAGVVDVLFGDVAPTGKLAFSWPRNMNQIPVNLGDKNYNPLFPVGYGLEY